MVSENIVETGEEIKEVEERKGGSLQETREQMAMWKSKVVSVATDLKGKG